MTVDRHILGQRVAYWRVHRGLTQQELADRLGRPRNWIWKIESGTLGSLERYSTLAQVADALTVDMQVLLGRDLSRLPDSTACVDADAVEAIRSALERYDSLGGLLAPDVSVEPPALDGLDKQVNYAWAAFERGRYGVLGATLPRLISDAQAAHAAYDQDDGVRAASLLAQAYQIAASALRKLGEHELGWLAADRAIRVTPQTGDPGWHGVATFRVGNALLAMGRTEAALRVQLGAVNQLSHDTTDDDTQARMSVYGIVLLQAAIAAARNGDSATVTDLFREASNVAAQLGTDTHHYHSSFGPTNLAVHRASAAVEMGEGPRAVEAHESIGPNVLERLPAERRANHLLDVARGYAQWASRTRRPSSWLPPTHSVRPRSAAAPSPSPSSASSAVAASSTTSRRPCASSP